MASAIPARTSGKPPAVRLREADLFPTLLSNLADRRLQFQVMLPGMKHRIEI
jgi:hypothetical protein